MSQLVYRLYGIIFPPALKDALPPGLKASVLSMLFRVTGRAAWAERLCAFNLRRGHYEEARRAHDLLFDVADRNGETEVSRRRQFSQFQFERRLFEETGESVYDPLFHCSVLPGEAVAAGRFKVDFGHLGLRINGRLDVPPEMPEEERPGAVRIYLGQRVIRRINLEYQEGRAKFSLSVKRSVLEHFPPHAELRVSTTDDQPLLFGTAKVAYLQIPHGRGDLEELMPDGSMLDKKGYLPVAEDEIKRRQDAYLDLYKLARDAFDEAVGTPLFLMYGTLLGLYRDGDFIPGDDDFDVGYVSAKTNPHAVRKEAKGIMLKLAKAGFTVTLNRRGKPFRLSHPAVPGDIHLDARPVWYQDGKVWAQRQAALELPLDGLREVEKTEFRHIEVYIPRKTKKFLKAYYGPGWKKPDPGYSNASQVVPPEVVENLNKTCLASNEILALKADLEKERARNPEAGELIAMALEDLYPLEAFQSRVGW